MPKQPKSTADIATSSFQHPQTQTNQPEYGQVAGIPPNLADITRDIDRLKNDFGEETRKRINFNTDIIGLFETVTVAPMGIPLSPYDQIKISVIAGTTALNVYDSVNHVWKKVTIA